MPKVLHGLLNLKRRRWRDLWGRTERWWVLPLYLAIIFVLHVLAMIVLEGLPLLDAVWLTATTIVTVGYGDVSAKTAAGRIATMLLMYVGAIFVVAVAINDWLDAKADKAERMVRGTWRWNVENHVLIIGTPERDALEYFRRLAKQIRCGRGWTEAPVLLLTRAFDGQGLPAALRDLGVVHRTGDVGTQADLEACDATLARGIIVLTDHEAEDASDARTFDLLHRLREAGYKGPIVAECVADANRPRLMAAGATSLVRPMRGFPEMLTRALFAPGAEQVIENLFTAEGDECLLIDLPTPARMTWLDVVTRVVGSGCGIPIAYRTPGGTVVSNPPGRETIEAAGLFVIVHDVQEARARDVIHAALAG